MNRFKILAFFFIFFGGIASAYLIIKNSVPVVDIKKEVAEKLPGNIINENPIQWVKDTALDTFSSAYLKNDSIKKSDIELNDVSSANITESVAKIMFDKMKKTDQSGENPFDSFNPNNFANQELSQEVFADFQKFFLKLDSSQDIGINDIKISKDNSLEAKAKYLETTGKIIFDNANEFYNKPHIAVENIAAFGNATGLDGLIESYDNIFNGFFNLAAPSDFSDIHLRYLNFLKRTKTFYSGIKNFKNDPLKIQLLVQLIPEIAEADLNLKQEFYQKVQDINS